AYKDGLDKGRADTWVKYHEDDDTFEVGGELKVWPGERKTGAPAWWIESQYRVTREGELRQVTAKVALHLEGVEITADLHGRAENKRLTPHLRIAAPGFQFEPSLPPVEVPPRGSVLNPSQPVNKLRGLRPGQRWRIPVVDPLTDSLKSALPSLAARPA